MSTVYRSQTLRDLEFLVRGHSRSLNIVPLKRMCAVSYSHWIATMAVFLAVSTQYTNVTDTGRIPHDGIDRACSLAAVARQKP